MVVNCRKKKSRLSFFEKLAEEITDAFFSVKTSGALRQKEMIEKEAKMSLAPSALGS